MNIDSLKEFKINNTNMLFSSLLEVSTSQVVATIGKAYWTRGPIGSEGEYDINYLIVVDSEQFKWYPNEHRTQAVESNVCLSVCCAVPGGRVSGGVHKPRRRRKVVGVGALLQHCQHVADECLGVVLRWSERRRVTRAWRRSGGVGTARRALCGTHQKLLQNTWKILRLANVRSRDKIKQKHYFS